MHTDTPKSVGILRCRQGTWRVDSALLRRTLKGLWTADTVFQITEVALPLFYFDLVCEVLETVQNGCSDLHDLELVGVHSNLHIFSSYKRHMHSKGHGMTIRMPALDIEYTLRFPLSRRHELFQVWGYCKYLLLHLVGCSFPKAYRFEDTNLCDRD